MIPTFRVVTPHVARRLRLQPGGRLTQQQQQVRWKRKDGHRYHIQQERPATKKQRKQYNRRKNDGKQHGRPGSKAGPRRELQRMQRQELLQPPPPKPSQLDMDTYTQDDALLDDLMGNTRRSQPNPVPAFYGHQQRRYMNRVVDRMEQLRRWNEDTSDSSAATDAVQALPPSLPTDSSISLALRAFRDTHRSEKVGLVAALRHVVQDCHVPMSAWGEYTYTTLLTCCATPAEGRRVLDLQRQHQHPISSYSWSILVDLYAQQADWRGCAAVHEDMLREGGVAPTLASYTSLLTACAKTIRNGRIPHEERAAAGKAAFTHWQDLQIVGLIPDVMTYGAMLSVYAARGQAEAAVGLLDDMARFEIAPTSYVYRQCLLSVARSHALALRYDSADTPRFRRREETTLHHGKLARQVLIQAEAASVEWDDGLVAALIQCAAVAGDMATAKAVFTAVQIRKEFTEWRLMGSDAHLARLRGEDVDDPVSEAFAELTMGDDGGDGGSALLSSDTSTSDGASNTTTMPTECNNYSSPESVRHRAFTRRKYGKDSRVLSALLLSCSKALDHRHIGSMWQGRENEGYYCINSLRLLAEPRKPEYTDDTIPGQKITDNLTWEGEHRDIEDPRKKFKGVHVDESVPATIDELDETFTRMFMNEETGELHEEFRKSTPADIWDLKYGAQGTTEVNSHIPLVEASQRPQPQQLEASQQPQLPEPTMYFDSDTMSWKERTVDSLSSDGSTPTPIAVAHTVPKVATTSAPASNLYFDYDTMTWQTREETTTPQVFPGDVSDLSSGPSSDGSELVSDDSDDEEEEVDFFGDDGDVGNLEALEKNLLQHAVGGDSDADDISTMQFEADSEAPTAKREVIFDAAEFQSFYLDLQQESVANGEGDVDENEAREVYLLMKEYGVDAEEHAMGDDSDSDVESSDSSTDAHEKVDDAEFSALGKQDEETNALVVGDEVGYDLVMNEENAIDHELDALREMLPAFPEARLRKVRDVFHKSLDNPPLLELIPVVRETMPDYISGSWLQKMSFLTAKFVAHQAAAEEKIDIHMLNGVLGLYTAAGSLDNALEFHQTEFKQYGFTPTQYSDRLVLQMFLKNNRFGRALAFKQSVESDERSLDIKAYGSLIEYCSRRKQLGSGMLLARECVALHGKKPEEACLKRLRLLSRQAGLEEQLDEIVGEDPFKWARYGEAKLKRESSKWGKRDVQHGANQLLRI